MKKQLLAIFMLVFLPVTAALAVKISSLYQAEVVVSAQSEAARIAAAKQGLLTVLIRMTGNAQIEKNPEISHALTNADDFVQTYHYAPAAAARQSLTQLLIFSFNKGGINLLLKSAGVSQWTDERPLVLVWVAQLTPQLESDILNNHSQAQLVNLMRQDSNRLGLPLVFPEMDMADASQVSVHDITAFNLPILKETGKRYSFDAMLIGSLEPGEDKFTSHWRLVIGDKQWEWTFDEKSQTLMVSKVMDQISQVLAANYVVPQQHAAAQRVTMNPQEVFDNKPIEGWSF